MYRLICSEIYAILSLEYVYEPCKFDIQLISSFRLWSLSFATYYLLSRKTKTKQKTCTNLLHTMKSVQMDNLKSWPSNYRIQFEDKLFFSLSYEMNELKPCSKYVVFILMGNVSSWLIWHVHCIHHHLFATSYVK